MKRFILDAFLILIVVSIGSTLNQQQPESTIQQRIDEFNRQIEHPAFLSQLNRRGN